MLINIMCSPACMRFVQDDACASSTVLHNCVAVSLHSSFSHTDHYSSKQDWCKLTKHIGSVQQSHSNTVPLWHLQRGHAFIKLRNHANSAWHIRRHFKVSFGLLRDSATTRYKVITFVWYDLCLPFFSAEPVQCIRHCNCLSLFEFHCYWWGSPCCRIQIGCPHTRFTDSDWCTF